MLENDRFRTGSMTSLRQPVPGEEASDYLTDTRVGSRITLPVPTYQDVGYSRLSTRGSRASRGREWRVKQVEGL